MVIWMWCSQHVGCPCDTHVVMIMWHACDMMWSHATVTVMLTALCNPTCRVSLCDNTHGGNARPRTMQHVVLSNQWCDLSTEAYLIEAEAYLIEAETSNQPINVHDGHPTVVNVIGIKIWTPASIYRWPPELTVDLQSWQLRSDVGICSCDSCVPFNPLCTQSLVPISVTYCTIDIHLSRSPLVILMRPLCTPILFSSVAKFNAQLIGNF